MAPKERSWKNSAVDMDDFGGSRPALKAETIKPANATVITVTDVEKIEVSDPDRDDGKRVSLVLQSEEYPERGFWLNKTGIKTLMERIGPKPSDWIGEQIPLVVVRVNNPRTGDIQPSLQVSSPAEWDEVTDSFVGSKRGASRRVVRRVVKKTRKAKK